MNHRRLTAVIIALALLGGWYYIVHAPTQLRLDDIDQKSQQLSAQLSDYKTTVAQVPALLQASAELAARRSRQNSVLFAKEDILRMFDQVTGEANSERLSVVEIAPPLSELLALNAAGKRTGEPLFLNMTIRVMGEYISFGRFAERVEQLPYFRGYNYFSILGAVDRSNPLVYSIGFRAILRSGQGQA